ncbi:hypothetical protein ABPG72_020261 [Tetrahymena utriculariae]
MIKILERQKRNFKLIRQINSQSTKPLIYNFFSKQQCLFQQQKVIFLANKFYFSTTIDYYQHVKRLEIHSSDKIDTPQLIDKFSNQLKEIDDLNHVIMVCVYYSNILRGRMEFDLAIEVMQVALNKMERNATFGHYKRKEMFLNYMAGNFLEQIESIIQFSDEIVLCNQLEIAASIFYLMLERLEKIKDSSVNQFAGRAYIGLACIHYTLQEYEEAVKCSVLFYETNKQQNLEGLIIAYISYKQLDKIDEANKILQTIKGKANIDESLLNIQKYILHAGLFNYTNAFQSQIEQIQKEEANIQLNDKTIERKAIWDEEKEVKKIANFIKSGQIEEGIMYYDAILNQLDDPEYDYFVRLEVLDVISQFYSSKKEYTKAIKMHLDLHQKLLEKRNYMVINDKKHLHNFVNLCDIYTKINDDNKTLEWHKKYHSFLLVNGYFSKFTPIVRAKLFGHMDCLVRLEQYDEALEYGDFIERYAKQFQLEKDYPQFYNDLKSRKLQLIKYLKDNQRLKKQYLQYYEFLKIFQNKEAFYQCLIYLLNFSFKDQDQEGIIKYSQDYLKVRSQFEKEDENLLNRKLMYLVLINHYYGRKEYEKTSKFINDAKPAFLKNKQYEELYSFLLIQICLIRNLKLKEDINQKIQEATNLFNQHFKGTNLESLTRAKGYLIQSRIYFELKDSQNCLDHIEQFLQQDQSKNVFQEDYLDLLKSLQQQEEYKQKINEIISKYSVQYKF